MAGIPTATNPTTMGTEAANKAATSRQSMAANFDQFLLLLTTQLQNQNPLEPLDTNQFTQQLVQFASVEQQIQTNQTLSALLSLSDSGKVGNAVNFIGAKVVAEGAATLFDGTTAEWNITTTSPASRAIVEVRDVNGTLIATNEIALTGTENKYTWNGVTSGGSKAEQGVYSLTVKAFDQQGKAVNASTDIMGTVDGVDLSGDEPLLKIGDIYVPMGLVKRIERPVAAA
jgi:flagellar basal-body rod modification protein FlgD